MCSKLDAHVFHSFLLAVSRNECIQACNIHNFLINEKLKGNKRLSLDHVFYSRYCFRLNVVPFHLVYLIFYCVFLIFVCT